MSEYWIGGVHAIEEALRSAEKEKKHEGMRLVYAKPGPRVKKILASADLERVK